LNFGKHPMLRFYEKHNLASKLFLFNSLTTIRDKVETKNSRRRNPTKEIVLKVPSPPTITTIHKHHHNGGAVCPSYRVRLMDPPNPMQVTSSKGVEQGPFSLVFYKRIK
jgi:hypothetical protein